MSVEFVCNVLGDVIHVAKASVIVGRGSEADVRVDDHDVSRRHCEIVVRADGIVVRDLGSTHGTWYEGRRIDGEVRITRRSRIALAENGVPVEILRALIDGRSVIEEVPDAALDSSHTVAMKTSEVAAVRAASARGQSNDPSDGANAPAPKSLFLRGFVIGTAIGLVGGLVAFLLL